MSRPLCILFKLLCQSKVATLAPDEINDSAEATLPKLFPSKLLYVADKCNESKYLIDANKISDADCLTLVAANNTTINTYSYSKRVVDVDYTWNFITAQADFLVHYSLLMDLRSRCLRDMRTGLAIPASLLSITPLSLNRVDAVHNDYKKLLGQFPELTRPTTKGETVKHGITHKIVTKDTLCSRANDD